MKQAVTDYYRDLIRVAGDNWNRFWYTPSDAFPLAVLRIFVGLMSLYFLFSHSSDLVRWFGPDGLLPAASVQSVERAMDPSRIPVMRFSYFNLTTAPAVLWILHLLAMAVVVALMVGFYTRAAAILSLVAILSYVHRGPIIAGQLEPLLTMMLFYLCLAPAGSYLSVDRIRRYRKQSDQPAYGRDTKQVPLSSVSATVALRLIQVHVALFYLYLGLSKLAGQTWWNGSAVWWLIAHTESRLVDLTFLHTAPYVVFFWAHLIVLFELSFGLLIWNRWVRPLLLVVAVPLWLSLALVTGLVSFCSMMLIVNLAFVRADALRSAWRWIANRCGLPSDVRVSSIAGAVGE